MMAEGRRFGFVPQLDMEKIFMEAQRRWLHPLEVCEIIKNHNRLTISPEPQNRPTSGSIYLFDRKITRYFRKDGHDWRKKKDGKTVKEAHEKLKYGSVELVHCYYAHGENNETFQRRSYWMLDKDFAHIAVVHYLNTKESSLHITGQLELPKYCPTNSSSFASPGENISRNHFPSAKPNYFPSQTGIMRTKQGPNRELYFNEEELCGPSLGNLTTTQFGVPTFNDTANNCTILYSSTQPQPQMQHFDSSLWSPQGTFPGEGVFANELGLEDHIDFDDTIFNGVFANDPGLEDGIDLENTIFDGVFSNEPGLEDDHGPMNGWQNLQDNFGLLQEDNIDEPGIVQLLDEGDSFSRWMSTELIGEVHVDSSQIKSNSDSLWNNVNVDGVLEDTRDSNDAHGVSSHAHGVASDAQMEMGLIISQDHLFSMVDHSPKWAYADSHTEVLVMGTFMNCEEELKNYKWSCMFGEIEVPCDLLPDGTLRCDSPSHKPGRVPFYITVSNRLACREIREFEFHDPNSQFLDTSFLNPNSDHSYHLDQFLCSAQKKYPWILLQKSYSRKIGCRSKDGQARVVVSYAITITSRTTTTSFCTVPSLHEWRTEC